MGPRLFSRGRAAIYAAPVEGDWLQWGRGSSAAEGGWDEKSLVACMTLQWGRGSSAAEGG